MFRLPRDEPHAPPLRVVYHTDGSVVAVCEDDPSQRVVLQPDQVVVYRVRPESLRKQLASALGLTVSRRRPGSLPGVVPVGLLEPAPSVAYPVVMVCHPDPGVFGTLVREAVQVEKRPVLVLTPTGDAWTDEVREWVEDHRGTMVAADDVVDADPDGKWVPGRMWALLRTTFLKRAGFNAKAVKRNKRGDGGGRDKQLRAHSVTVGRALRTLIGNQRAFVRNARKTGAAEFDLPYITQERIAEVAGNRCKDYHITRMRTSGKYPSIVRLLDALNDIDALMALPVK